MAGDFMNEPNFATTPRRSNWWRLFLFVAAGVVVLLGLLLWWNGRAAEEAAQASEAAEMNEAAGNAAPLELDAEAQERIGLETAEAQVTPLSAQIRITGVIGPDETRVAHIRSLSTGVITGVMVRRGDRVTAGQPLLTYDNVELGQTVAGYRSALAALESARGEAEVARLALERADRLVEIGGIAQAEHQRRKAEYAAAQAAVRSSEAQLANLRQTLSRFGMSEDALKERAADAPAGARSTLRAPLAGVVLEVQAVRGETVSPERELATVADLSTVWILGDVYERDLASVAEGREARVVTDAYPDEPFGCRVTYVSQVLDPQTRTATLRCEAKNPNRRLRLQMFARLEIPAGAAREVVAIPREAVQQIDGEPSVFVRTGDDSFERRAVRLGATTEEWAEVVAGVQRGERVVTTGAVMLKSRLKAGEFAESEEDERK
jgi:cobalt-zinc-cadmium efflux system membrane fusion protein